MHLLKTKKRLFCNYTEHEKAEKAERLSSLRLRMEQLEAKRKSMMDDYKAQIDESDAEILSLSRLVDDGGEERLVPCVIEYNVPKSGLKTITRRDIDDSWTEEMEEGDYNLFPQTEEHETLALPEAEVVEEDEPAISYRETYGFNPDKYDFAKYIVIKSEDDFNSLEIEPEDDYPLFEGALLVQSTYEEIKKVIPFCSYSYRSNTVDGLAWYGFPQLEKVAEHEQTNG